MRGAAAAAVGPKTARVNRISIIEWDDPDLPSNYPVESGWVDIDAGIDATGATDATADLQTYFDGLSNGAKVRFPVNGIYRMDGTLTISGLAGLAIDGRGSTLTTSYDAPGTRRHVVLDLCSDVYITNLAVDGPTTLDPLLDAAYDATKESSHGWSILGCTRVLLDGVEANNVWGDWVYVYKSGTTQPSHITIRNSTFTDCSRQGFAVVTGNNILFQGNSCGDGRRAAIDLETNTASESISYVKIKDNTWGTYRLNYVANKGAASVVEYVWISGNTTDTGMVTEIDVDLPGLRRNFVFQNNTSTFTWGTSSLRLVGAIYVDNIIVRNNVQPFDNRGMKFLGVNKTRNWMSVGNTGTNSYGDFIMKVAYEDLGTDPTGLEGASMPSFVGRNSATTITTSMNVPLPAGCQAGDLCILSVGHNNTPWDEPTGYTSLWAGSSEPWGTWRFSYKFLDAADISSGIIAHTFAEGGSSNRSLGVTYVWRNAGTPYGVTSNLNEDNSIAHARTTGPTTSAAGLQINLIGTADGNIVFTPGYPDRVGSDEVEQPFSVTSTGFVGLVIGGGAIPVYGVGKCADRKWWMSASNQSIALAFVLPYAA